MKSQNSKLENPELANAVGTKTYLCLEWQDWKVSSPPKNQQIFVIIRLENGYYPVTATYYDEVIPATGPFKESRWKQVKFDDMLPTIFLGGPEEHRLIAWARLVEVNSLDKKKKLRKIEAR